MTRPLGPSSRSSFAKVRRDHATETAEDYVEAISALLREKGECRVKDLAVHMGVSHVTVTRTITRLQELALIDREQYRPIRLTPRGERLAAESRRRHEIVLSFLLVLGVPADEARRDAEGIEHHTGRQTLAAMRRFLAGGGSSPGSEA